jgi:hypothetical protein
LSRATIRKEFERRFTARRMAQDYLSVYRNLTESGTRRLRLVSDEAHS